MASEILYKGDGILKLTASFATGKTWGSYEEVIVEAIDKNGVVIQEAGYPASVADTDLYVPDTTSPIMYFYMLSSNRNLFSGAVTWKLKYKEANARFTDDSYYNPTFELKGIYLSL
jgi:hypothetical protein